jgi:hypothetical protein
MMGAGYREGTNNYLGIDAGQPVLVQWLMNGAARMTGTEATPGHKALYGRCGSYC